MAFIFDPSVPVGVDRPWLHGDQALATRVRMVLETRPGQVPWRPDFGCDLESLVGESTTGELISKARWRIEAALRQWIPDATVDKVEVAAVPAADQYVGGPNRQVPLAESALLTMGVQASLQVDVELTGPDGPVAMTALVEP